MENNIVIKKKGEAYIVEYGEAFFYCVIGKNGVTSDKKEGDWMTPVGTFNIQEVFYRKDRVEAFPCDFELNPISEDDGWCDDSVSPEYNHFVKIPYPFSTENLWREDDLYDIVVVLDYNSDPVIPGKGSAIFIHIAKEGMQYTKGCVALKKDDLIKLLDLIHKDTQVQIQQN
jgi:L,D-peptidoglycan transpeptidase YkuD (ErfK/YbiS/YcfS/YnhG family)